MPMGVADTYGKAYFSENAVFADVYNCVFRRYHIPHVINPDDLYDLDSTLISVPYGNNAVLPVQRHRDIVKVWKKPDGQLVILILGMELQDEIHYAMPPRGMLYDSLNLVQQVAKAASSYKSKKNQSNADIVLNEDGNVKIKLSNAEFLSGFRKEDKLVPVLTVVVYLGQAPWDGPLSTHEMYALEDSDFLKIIPNYTTILVQPSDFKSDADLAQIKTDLRVIFRLLRDRKNEEKLAEYTKNERDKTGISLAGAQLLNGYGFQFDLESAKGGTLTMCEGLAGAYNILKTEALAKVVCNVMKQFHVPMEEALETVELEQRDEVREKIHAMQKGG